MSEQRKKAAERLVPEDSLIRLTSVSKVPYLHRQEHPRIAHSHHGELEVHMSVSGSSEMLLDSMPYYLQTGDIIIIDSDVVHDEINNKTHDMTSIVLSIAGLQIPGLPENTLVHPDQSPLIPRGAHSPLLQNLMEALCDSVMGESGGQEEIDHYMLCTLIAWLRHLLSANKQPDALRNRRRKMSPVTLAKQYIDTHYMEDLTLAKIAEAATISPYHLSHIFKQETRFSPIQYLTRRRLGEAETLLIHSDEQVTQIALKIGYGTVSNFNSSFLKYVGMSPNQYRKIHRQVQAQRSSVAAGRARGGLPEQI